ncbi:MAG: hypothetical protein OCD00_02055 [Colwellia sp.]
MNTKAVSFLDGLNENYRALEAKLLKTTDHNEQSSIKRKLEYIECAIQRHTANYDY